MSRRSLRGRKPDREEEGTKKNQEGDENMVKEDDPDEKRKSRWLRN